MAHPILDQPTKPGGRLARINVEQYHRMLETGILHDGDRIELLDGLLVYKDRSARGEGEMTIGKGHQFSVNRLTRLDRLLTQFGCYMQVQGAITLPPNHEPEPDGAIVRGQDSDYLDHHPGPSDLPCVIEVSDSSLPHDRTAKLAIYASAGIPQYVIVNLIDNCVETYEQPIPAEGRYALPAVLQPGSMVSLNVGTGASLEVPVRDLLP